MNLDMLSKHTVLTTQIMQAVAADPVVGFRCNHVLFSSLLVERVGDNTFSVRPATEAEVHEGQSIHNGLVHPGVKLGWERYLRLKKAAARMSDDDHKLLTELMLEWAEDYARYLLGMQSDIVQRQVL